MAHSDSFKSLTIQFSLNELRLLTNALNEVLNGVDFGEPEFHTRLGSTKLEADLLLQRLLTEVRH